MHYGAGIMGSVARVGQSLDQHCREIKAIERKLENPKVPFDKRIRLLSRIPVVKAKIAQLCGRLQVG